MAMWAGVQNVSRPMLSCHEISQVTPMAMLVRAKAMRKLVQKLELRVRDCPGACDDSAGAGIAKASVLLAEEPMRK